MQVNKRESMYALLVAVAVMIGITIYGSCSADEDYDNYSSGDELFTLADGIMEQGREGNMFNWEVLHHYDKTYYFQFIPSLNPNLNTTTDTVTCQFDLVHMNMTEFSTNNFHYTSTYGDTVYVSNVRSRSSGHHHYIYIIIRNVRKCHLNNPDIDTILISEKQETYMLN